MEQQAVRNKQSMPADFGPQLGKFVFELLHPRAPRRWQVCAQESVRNFVMKAIYDDCESPDSVAHD